MKINNLIIKIFLGLYLIIIIAGVVVFENIGFAGGGLEKNTHSVSSSETQADIVNNISSETTSKTEPASSTIKETASSQAASKPESTAAMESQTSNTQESAITGTTSEPAEPETKESESEKTQPATQTATAPQPSYTFANGHITNTSAIKSYRVTGASYVNMHKDKTGSHSFATVPGGTTGSIISVGAYYTLIDYNGTQGYVYNSYLEVY